MKKFRRVMYWLGLIFIVALSVFSAIGAVKGADWSQAFFNSLPLSVYWSAFAVLIAVSFFVFPRLIKKPGLLAMHLGCILIITGSMWSSEVGHELQRKYLDSDKVQSAYMAIIENTSYDTLYDNTDVLYKHYFNKVAEGVNPDSMHKLPFSIKLNDFRIEYYDTKKLVAVDNDGLVKSEFVKIGKTIDLGPDYGTVTPIKAFNNLKINIEEGKTVGTEGQGSEPNPALEVLVELPNGEQKTKFIYEKFPDFNVIEKLYQLKFISIISDYISELEVIKDGETVLKKDIEVNDPLHYGGYHFYQSSYQDLKDGTYATILSATSDSGLYPVFIGFFLLCAGIVYHQWLEQIFKKKTK